MSTLKTGVIGLGIGKHHAMVLSGMPEVDLVAVADLKEEISSHLGEQLDVDVYSDGVAMLNDETLDFVCLCVPPAMHLPFTREAAGRGINVFCEKPMAPTLEDCDKMVESCRASDVKLMIGHKKRFSPAFNFIKEQTHDKFGPIHWAGIHYACGRVKMDWVWDEDNGGGPLLENSVHAFDTLRFLIGEVETVFAEGGNAFNPNRAPQPDAAAVSLRFTNGAVASVACGQTWEWGLSKESSHFAHDGAVVELAGTFDNPEHLRYVLRDEPENVVQVDRPEHDLFELELRHFVSCLADDTTPLANGADARKSVAVSLAVKESIRSGELVEM